MGIKERGVIPPQPVEAFRDGRWQRGELDRWSREPEGWHGRVRLDRTGHVGWFQYPDHLREIESR